MSTTHDNPDNAPTATDGRLAKTLARHTAATDGWAMFCPDTAPAFASNAQPGLDWCCRGCATILAAAVHEGQFLDVLFRCPACDLVGASPTRCPGQPLAGRPVLAPPRRYWLGSAVNLVDKPVMTVGQQALDGYLTETGRSTSGTATAAVPTAITSAGLRALASQAKDLLGEEYAALHAADRRTQASPTPPPRRHRLIDLITFAEATATAIKTSGTTATTVDANRLAELVGTVAMFARWRNHPAWPELVHSLSTQTEGKHALMLLVIASYLVDAGNGVGIVPNAGKGRIPDIWVEPSLVERLHLEVKTPQALRGPSATHITVPEAENLVERVLKKAASTVRGQLDPRHSGIVAIGGFHLGAGALECLADAARRVLDRQAQAGRKGHLAAVVVSELSYETRTVRQPYGSSERVHFSTTFTTRLVRHPGYRGELSIAERAAPVADEPALPWITADA